MSHDNPSPEGPIHVYDGIEEMDNKLPNWWLGLLWGTLLFAVGYWFYVQMSGQVPSSMARFEAEQKALHDQSKQGDTLSDAVLLALAKDPAAVAGGAKVFATQCAACHGAHAEGVIGPNLTDAFWLHGGGPLELHATVEHGVPEKGMPTWGPVLGPERVRQVVAYLLTIEDTNVPGKAPQGERVPAAKGK